MAEEAKEKKSSKDKLLDEARSRLKRAQDSESKNRERAKAAIKFRALDQWPEGIKKDRDNPHQEGGPRPCLVLDKTNQYINQVKNDQRQNRSSIKVRPVDDKADPEVAEVLNGIIRHIEDNSHADLAYDTAFEATLDGGFGYWRIVTDYADEMSFEQEILIKRIRNRFTVFLDPDHEQPDGSDAKWGFVIEDMKRDDFKREYPDAELVDFEHKDNADWCSEETIRVAEYFRLEPKSVKIHQLADGSVVSDEELPEGAQIIQSRNATVNVVKWSKLSAAEELDNREWPGKYIPIVEVVGNELDIEGERRLSGMLDESTQDSQRMHNYAMSAFVESVTLAPRAPWVAYSGQLEGHEEEWKESNRTNIAVLQAKPVIEETTGTVLPLPQRLPPPGIPSGWQALLQNTENGLQASLGMYQADVGAPSNEKSGKAILARQRAGDTGSFHYFDNLARSIRHTGRILIDLIPKIYDTKRIVRILGEDGEPSVAKIDPELQAAKQEELDEMGKAIGPIYNPTIGRYDVTVSTGPAYTTKRQEAAEFMTQVTQSNPEMFNVVGDLMFKNLDMPGAEEIAERLQKMLPPQLQEEQDPRLAQAEQAMQQMQAEAQQAIQQLQGQLQQATQGAEAQKLNIEFYKAQTDRLKVENEGKDIRAMLENIMQMVGQHHEVLSQPQQIDQQF